MTVYDEIRQERAGFGEGFDNHHADGSLAAAAACYAWGPPGASTPASRSIPGPWPPASDLTGLAHQEQLGGALPWPKGWHGTWDERLKHPRRQQLIIAAALIVAEVERLDRAANRAKPVCATCRDTHQMSLHNDDEEERFVMCTRCPSPCEKCRQGAYCATTPCACACHRPAPSSKGQPEADNWAIVELYGHRRLAGQVSPAPFPEGFVRIDTVQGVTQVYNPKAIFSLTWVTERAARARENRQEERLEALRLALGRIARGEVPPADTAQATLAADDKRRPEQDDSTGDQEDWP